MIVIKVGGGKDIDVDAVCDDLAAMRQEGREVLLVHGGAETTNEVATALGHPPEFLESESGYTSRRTDRRTLEIFEMVYCGQLNKMWVEKLQTRGVQAVGLSGLDGRIFEGRRKDTLRVRMGGRRLVLRDDWTGTVDQVNVDLLRLLLGAGYLPVLTPPGSSETRRGDQRRRRSRRRRRRRRVRRRGAGDPLQRARPAAQLPRRVDADPRDPARPRRRVPRGGAGPHEEEGARRDRSARGRGRQGDLRRRAQGAADHRGAGG